MIEVHKTAAFQTWFVRLRDVEAAARINLRIRRLSLGNIGDAKSVGDGVHELRVHVGPGYRIYFARRRRDIVVLLCGGDKSTQHRDIAKAKQLARDV